MSRAIRVLHKSEIAIVLKLLSMITPPKHIVIQDKSRLLNLFDSNSPYDLIWCLMFGHCQEWIGYVGHKERA